MDRKSRKTEDKKVVRSTKDRGDLKKSLLAKVFEDLDILDFLPGRGCGDTLKTNVFRASKVTSRVRVEKKKSDETEAKNTPLAAGINETKNVYEDVDDSEKTEQNSRTLPKGENANATKVVERKKLEDKTKATPLTTSKDVKIGTDKTEECDESDQILTVNKLEADRRKFDGVGGLEGLKVKNAPPPPVKCCKVPDKVEAQNRTYLDLEGRKQLRARYTVKIKNSQNLSKMFNLKEGTKIIVKNDERDTKKQIEDETEKIKPIELVRQNIQTETPKTTKKPKEPTTVQRKPIIKTIRFNNDNRVYKAVTFIDQKESTPLQIKIPNDFKREKEKYTAETNTPKYRIKSEVSKVTVQTKPIKRKKEKSFALKKRTLSPVIASTYRSPPTEVAKWAPSCMNRHTKPYYEAWVDTTLAAISKCSESEKKLLGKQNMIKTFKRALQMERASSPELVYEKFKDERYTGRITVNNSKTMRKVPNKVQT